MSVAGGEPYFMRHGVVCIFQAESQHSDMIRAVRSVVICGEGMGAGGGASPVRVVENDSRG